MSSHSDFFRKYIDILAEADSPFKVGDKIGYTFVQCHPPETHTGTIVKIGPHNSGQIQWDDGAGPSQSAYDTADVHAGYYNLHWARKADAPTSMGGAGLDEEDEHPNLGDDTDPVQARGPIQQGDKVAITNTAAGNIKTFNATVVQVLPNNKLKLSFADARGDYQGPSNSELQQMGGQPAGNGDIFDAHWVRKLK